MRNTYYKYVQRNNAAGEFSDEREVLLTAIDDKSSKIELAVSYRDERGKMATAIILNEQEQDYLIAEILRRRGVVVKFGTVAGYPATIIEQRIVEPISSIPKTEHP